MWFLPGQPPPPTPGPTAAGLCPSLQPPARLRGQSTARLTISVPQSGQTAAGSLEILPVLKIKAGHLITQDLHVWWKRSWGPGFRTLHRGPSQDPELQSRRLKLPQPRAAASSLPTQLGPRNPPPPHCSEHASPGGRGAEGRGSPTLERGRGVCMLAPTRVVAGGGCRARWPM